MNNAFLDGLAREPSESVHQQVAVGTAAMNETPRMGGPRFPRKGLVS